MALAPTPAPDWAMWNAKRRQQALVDALPPGIRHIVTQWGRTDEAKVHMYIAGLNHNEVETLCRNLGDTLRCDYDRGPQEFLDSQRAAELSEMVEAGPGDTPVPPAGGGVDASAGLERYLRPRGWRRRPPRRR